MLRRHRRRAFTLIELLVVIAIIGVLLALLLPAVQKVREAANRASCQNRMKQLALALHNYYDSNGHLPASAMWQNPGDTATPGNYGTEPLEPWSVALLPYLENEALYQRFIQTGPYGTWLSLEYFHDTAPNAALLSIRNVSFECPSDPNSNPANANINFLGVQGGPPFNSGLGCYQMDPGAGPAYDCVNGVMGNSSAVKFSDIIDGTTNTFMLGESRFSPIANPGYYGFYVGSWAATYQSPTRFGAPPNGMQSSNVCATLNPINSSTCDPTLPWDGVFTRCFQIETSTFGSYHTGGCNFACADGSVHFINQNISITIFQAAGTIADGAPGDIFQ